jgi:hypothetical protein
VWGSPDSETVVLAEGPENACTLAVSLCEEIGKGELAALSAVTAGGIEAFDPWPKTRRIIVAADRDEHKPGTAGYKRGERAARNLAMRLAGERRQIEVLIALPGVAGTKYDLLDLFQDTDPDRVRNVVFAALLFQPTADEIAEFKRRSRRKSELEEIAQRYPLPSLIDLRVEYRHTEDDRVWLHKYQGFTEDKETHERIAIWEAVSSPFGALVLLQSMGHQIAFGLRVHVRTFTGATNTIDFMRTELPQLGASGVRSALMGAGVRVANGGETTVVEILKQAEPTDCIDVTQSFGWHRSNGDVFLTLGGRQWRQLK